MEIVAKKYPRLRAFIVILVLSLLLIAVGAGLLVASSKVVNFPDALDYFGLALIIIGAACTAMMIFALVHYCRLPAVLISYENGVLTLPKGFQCRAEEVTEINYNEAKPYYKNISYDFGFGLIKFKVNGRKIKVYYVASPAGVSERLKELVTEAKILSDVK